MKEKANILVLGTSGAGKSTLINAVIGREVAKVGFGKHGTEKMEPYVSEDLNFQLIDSRGFEYSYLNTKKAVHDMRTWMKSGLKDEKPRIHMLWFCVDATSKRFTKTTFKTVEAVKKEWPNIPIIVVLTKSFFDTEDNDNIAMVKETFLKVSKKTGMPKAIIPVLAQSPKGKDILPRGIDELIKVTEENLDDAVRDSNEAVKKYDLKSKRRLAQGATFAAATSGGLVGISPVPIPDGAVLTTLETLLITTIAKIYEQNKSEDKTKELISRIVETGTVSMVAKTALNQLKLIPGIANLAADVLNAIVAGAIVLGIGEAACIIMEKVYTGEMSAEDLDRINDIAEKQMGTIVKKISETISSQDGKIVVNDILKAVFIKENQST